MAEKKFLDDQGTHYFATKIVNYITEAVLNKIKDEISEANAAHGNIASVKAVLAALKDGIEGITKIHMAIVEAGLDPVTKKPAVADPESNVIYLVQRDADTYSQWVYIDNTWWDLGCTQATMDDYWALDDLKPITTNEIDDLCDEAGM